MHKERFAPFQNYVLCFSFPIFRGVGAKNSQENFEKPSFEKLENEQVMRRRQNKRPHDAYTVFGGGYK